MIVNRIGDFSLVLSILLIFYLFNGVDYFTIFALAPFFAENTISIFNIDISIK